jgi:hypothetical protein
MANTKYKLGAFEKCTAIKDQKSEIQDIGPQSH